jgi:hypothetical protein
MAFDPFEIQIAYYQSPVFRSFVARATRAHLDPIFLSPPADFLRCRPRRLLPAVLCLLPAAAFPQFRPLFSDYCRPLASSRPIACYSSAGSARCSPARPPAAVLWPPAGPPPAAIPRRPVPTAPCQAGIYVRSFYWFYLPARLGPSD